MFSNRSALKAKKEKCCVALIARPLEKRNVIGKGHNFCQVGFFFFLFGEKNGEKHPNLVFLGAIKKEKIIKRKNKKQNKCD